MSRSRGARWCALVAGALVASVPLASVTQVGSVAAVDPVTWQVQSDYFGERDEIAQTRTIRSMALSADDSAVYTGYIQSPNVATNALRKVDSDVLAVPGTDHVIFGNGMPGGTGGFGQVDGQPAYAGGATGTFHGWIPTANSPRGLDTDDRGYVYAALSSGISPANEVRIYDEDLTTQVGAFTVVGPTGIAIHEEAGTYYAYVATDTSLRRWDVTNVAAPVLDAAWPEWLPLGFTGGKGLAVDTDGTIFFAGGGVVRRISADGMTVTHTSAPIANASDVAVFQSKLYVITSSNPIVPEVWVLNKADLTSAGPNLVVPDLQAPTRARGSLAQFTAIDVSADGRLYISEENYTAGSNGIPSYTPPATSFNPTPGTITGRIYFDRVLVSSPVDDVNTPPVVTGPGDQSAVEDVSTTFDLGSFSDAVSTGPWDVDVDWGDSSSSSFAVGATGSLGTLDHTYADSGPYTVEVCVTDEQVASDCATFTVNVDDSIGQAAKQEVIDALETELTGNAKADRPITDAIKAIEKSLDPANWVDNESPTESRGNRIFDAEKKAVASLMKVASPSAVVTDAIDDLVRIDRTIAETAIADAIDRGGSQSRIDKANSWMAKAATELSKGRPDMAIENYKKAWTEAIKA